jgi:hypothetical protein
MKKCNVAIRLIIPENYEFIPVFVPISVESFLQIDTLYSYSSALAGYPG